MNGYAYAIFARSTRHKKKKIHPKENRQDARERGTA